MPTTIGPLALTFSDWVRRNDPDGSIATIIEIMSQTNEVVDDILVIEGNLPTGHRTTVRVGLPQATWRQLNYGVVPTKSVTAQITDDCGMLEAYSIVDKKLADLNGATGAFRLSEDVAFLEGMNQQYAATIWYGNTGINPERFMGLSPRYNTVNTANAPIAANVIDAGGTGSTNMSIWLITWGPQALHGIFPKGMAASGGLKMTDHGTTRAGLDANNHPFEAYTTHFGWDVGLTVRDWRYAVRICNVDVTTLSGASPPNLIVAMIRAMHRLPTQPAAAGPVQKLDTPQQGLSGGRCKFYANRTGRTWLDIQAVNKANVLLKLDEWDGKPITTFRGVPIGTSDALLNTESRVV